ncbi:hypothetical protein MYRNA_218 [Mycobacterium phage Myrna]|uniref:Uncharacterized protein n=1 Tax=Mycobacterium phage Myrna TaxID=546805 RepID=B5LJI8_9CAUD|nr:gp218 [Mycobacterium phage Myrna]ACH62185.1 hypothetical protein MYRNA_218 [Mycobacterium phage Myrna]
MAVASIDVLGVKVTFRHRDAALISDNELADIEEIVEAEQESLHYRTEDTGTEVLREIEFLTDYVNPRQARYNTVSDVTGTPE